MAAGAKVRVWDRDRGMKRAVKTLVRCKGLRVTVGWHEKDRHGDEGLPTAGIAAVHEFGSQDGRVPPRPTLGPTGDANRLRYQARLRDLLAEAAIGKRTVEGAGVVLGSQVVADEKRAITDLGWPPLAESTVAKKGSSKPLIDTGAMRDQVGFEVKVIP